MTGNTALRESILHALITSGERKDPLYEQMVDETTAILNSINDNQILEDINRMCEYMSNRQPRNSWGWRNAIRSFLDTNGCHVLIATYWNIDAIADSDLSLEAFIVLVTALMARDDVDTDENGRISTIEAHLYAYRRYREYPSAQDHLNLYSNDSEYIDAVQACHEHVEQLIPYLNERGAWNFDAQEFHRYRAHGVLSDGWV